jgi:nitrogen regulatory protein PII-like uncharacterized protein
MDITVTMPIKQYESMKRQIETLKEQNISHFIQRKYTNMSKNEFKVIVDDEGLEKAIWKHIEKEFGRSVCVERKISE